MPVYESHFEEAAPNWFAELGYRKISAYDIPPAPDGVTPERANYKQVILVERLRAKLIELNPCLPLQAIARVNRVFKDKPGGLIVDYIGIGQELKQALKDYTSSGGQGKPTFDAEEAIPLLIEKIEVARGMLHGFDYEDFETESYELLAGAADHILGLREDSRRRDGRQRFSDCVTTITKAFALCCTLDEAMVYREEIAFFQAIKAVLNKHDTVSSKLTDDQREHALRQIVSRAVMSNELIDIFAAAGLKKPNIGILTAVIHG